MAGLTTDGQDWQAKSALKVMSWFRRDKEKNRYYLLAGMGGRSARRKRRLLLRWSIAIGLLTSALLAYALYALSTSR